jgi:hypothetical protein
MKPTVLYFGLLIILALLASCESQESSPTSNEGIVTDYDILVERLQDAGATVEPTGNSNQPFFTPQGQVIAVDGQDVQVFEYATAADADSEADLVSPDGASVGTFMMTWIATPHFYKSGKFIVLYVGDLSDTITILEGALGPQFAGG